MRNDIVYQYRTTTRTGTNFCVWNASICYIWFFYLKWCNLSSLIIAHVGTIVRCKFSLEWITKDSLVFPTIQLRLIYMTPIHTSMWKDYSIYMIMYKGNKGDSCIWAIQRFSTFNLSDVRNTSVYGPINHTGFQENGRITIWHWLFLHHSTTFYWCF